MSSKNDRQTRTTTGSSSGSVEIENIYEVAAVCEEWGNVTSAHHLKSCAAEIDRLRTRIRQAADYIEREAGEPTEVSQFLREALDD